MVEGRCLGKGLGRAKFQELGQKGYKKIDMLLLGHGWQTIIAFTPSELELNPKFPIQRSLCCQQISQAC